MNRTLPAPAGDVALLVARLLLGTIMFAHGYQKLMVDGLGRTTQGFESMSIPVAIVSASFVTVVEVVGGVLLVLGLLTSVVSALMGVVMIGAAGFVHLRHGIFVAEGGWELVGAIGAALLALAAAGPGRLSLTHVLRGGSRSGTAPSVTAAPAPAPVPAFAAAPVPVEPVPPAGLPLTPLVRADAPYPAPGPPPGRRPSPTRIDAGA